MKLTDEAKRNILDSFLENIYYISNKEFQKRIWIRGEGPEWDSFDDAICDFFQAEEPIIEKYQDFGITDHQCSLLKKFKDELRAFSEYSATS